MLINECEPSPINLRVLIQNIALRKYYPENGLTELVKPESRRYRLNRATDVAPIRGKGRCDTISKRMIMGHRSA